MATQTRIGATHIAHHVLSGRRFAIPKLLGAVSVAATLLTSPVQGQIYEPAPPGFYPVQVQPTQVQPFQMQPAQMQPFQNYPGQPARPAQMRRMMSPPQQYQQQHPQGMAPQMQPGFQPQQYPVSRPDLSNQFNSGNTALDQPYTPIRNVALSPQSQTTVQKIQDLASRHPFCIVLGEKIASVLIRSETSDAGPFQEMIMGALVSGTQQTNTRTSIDFRDSPSAISLNFVLQGVTYSQTSSQIRQSSIQSAGSIEFEVAKQVDFDGLQLSTRTPSAFMTVRQQNLGASTPISPIPLLGPLTSGIIMNAAEQRRPQTESIAAHRITQLVAPAFNSKIDEQLVKINNLLGGDLRNRLTQAELYPSHVATKSTNDAAIWGVAFEPQATAQSSIIKTISGQSRRGDGMPARFLLTNGQTESPGYADTQLFSALVSGTEDDVSRRATVLVHESLLSDIVHRYEISGKAALPDMLQAYLKDAAGGGDASALGTLVIAKENPLEAKINTAELLLTVRAGFQPVVGSPIPTQEVVFSFKPILNDHSITLKPELVSMKPLVPVENTNRLLQIAGDAMIRSAIEQRLKEINIPRTFYLPRDSERGPLALRLATLTLTDGWMSGSYEVASNQSADAGSTQGYDVQATLPSGLFELFN